MKIFTKLFNIFKVFTLIFISSFPVFAINSQIGTRAFCYCKILAQESTSFDIYTLSDFENFATGVNNGSLQNATVSLKNDIYFNTGDNFTYNHPSVGTYSKPFCGTFNGNNHTIFGLYNKNSFSEYCSLFGYLNGASVINLKFKNANLTATNSSAICFSATNSLFNSISFEGTINSLTSSAGLVINLTNSTIVNSSASGKIASQGQDCAGIACYATNSHILNCYNNANITSSYNAGGICYTADSNCSIINCLNSSTIKGSSYLTTGAIAGYNLGAVKNCYYKSLILNNKNVSATSNNKDSALNNCFGFSDFNNQEEITVGSNIYYGTLNALNAGTSFYYANEIVLINWTNPENPQLSTSKQENEFLTKLICEDIVFGNIPEPYILSKYGNPEFYYSISENGEFTKSHPISAGTYFVKAVINETDAYTGLISDAIEFSILQAIDNIILERESLSKVYDGKSFTNPNATNLSQSEIFYSYYLKTDTTFENEIANPVNCGDYILKIYTQNSANYTGFTKTVAFSITKASLTDKTENILTTYNGSSYSINLSLDSFLNSDIMSLGSTSYSLDGINYTNSNPSFKDCGSYTVYYKIEFENYKTIFGQKNITINKATYKNVTHASLSGVYSSSASLKDYTLATGFVWKDSSITPTCDTTLYKAVYNLDPLNFEDFELDIEIILDKQIVSAPEFSEVYTYNGIAQTFSFKNLNSSIINVNYFSKTNAGSYPVVCTLKDTINYTFTNHESEYTIYFVINKANFENKSLNINYSTVYEPNKTFQNYEDILREKFDIPQYYCFTNTNIQITAGSHQVSMYYNSDPENYNNFYFDITLNITKASYDEIMFEYASDTPFTIGENGEYIFTYCATPIAIFLTGLPLGVNAVIIGDNEINVGTYTASATLTGDPNYYTPEIAPLSYIIKKADYTAFDENSLSFTYENNLLTFSYLNDFTVKIKTDKSKEYSNSLYITAGRIHTVYYLIESQNFNNIEGVKTIYLNGSEGDSVSPNPPTINESKNSNTTTNSNTKNIVLICVAILALIGITFIVIIKVKKKDRFN